MLFLLLQISFRPEDEGIGFINTTPACMNMWTSYKITLTYVSVGEYDEAY